MDKLWAPWRSKYISKAGSGKGCIFCSKPKSKRDKANYILCRGPHSFSILNIYPYNNGHMMIVPYRHVNDISKLSDAEILDITRLLKGSQELLSKTMRPDGYNIGMNIGRAAGAGLKDHVHIHLVPRWAGDSNFMPVLTSTKVISESLDALYDRLRKCSRAGK